MEIVSWNVAGINAAIKKGLREFMQKQDADVYCFQEVKATQEKLPKFQLQGYKEFHSISEVKKGYSGVSIYTKVAPLSVQKMGIDDFDNEGRVIALEFESFFLVNTYFPSSNRELSRLPFKLKFNDAFLQFCKKLEKKKPVVIAADFNVAHKEIDIRNAKQNEGNAGYTKEEREWFDSFLSAGYIDTFREFTKEPDHYTWWSYLGDVRSRNIGWRIDYFVISEKLRKYLKKSIILKDVMGSDHCPILVEMKN
ncbi:MAG: exodeoxyribonuclease III [Candidatus Micrarchaeales archaeon]